MKNPARVLLVEDHEIVRMALRELINETLDLRVVAEADSLAQANQALQTQPLDLILLDLTLGQEDGAVLLQQLAHYIPAPRVLILSMHDDAALGSHLVGLGARGFIRKGAGASEILRASRAVLNGEIVLSSRAAQPAIAVAPGPRTSPVDSLTARERLVLEGVGRGESSKEIATQLGVSAQTIDVYRFKIRQKLGVENPSDLRQFALALAHTAKSSSGA